MHYRIPPELFDLVIDSFTEWPTFNPGLGVRMSKSELGACSLVCRHWARRCRYWVFASVALKSREDFVALLHLIDSAEEFDEFPSLRECIQEVNIQHSGAWEIPWYHCILAEFTAREIELDPDRVALELKESYVAAAAAGAQMAHYAPRSLSTSLPRTMPRSLFSHGILTLSDMRFRRVQDLLRLIDDQADLQQITWVRVSFDAGVSVPAARQRTRRAWGGMETVATSAWSDVVLEMQIMFLIAAEKVPPSLLVLPDAWKAMASAANALVLPGNTLQLELGFRGEGLGITYQSTALRSATTHLLEFQITAPTPRIAHPYVSNARLWLRPSLTAEDLPKLNWADFEDTLLSLSPAPDIELVVESRDSTSTARTLFGRLLAGILPSSDPNQIASTSPRALLPRARAMSKLTVRMMLTDRSREWRKFEDLKMSEVLKQPDTYEVHGKTLTLNPEEKLKVMFCDSEEEKRSVLEELAQRKAQVHGAEGNDNQM